MLRCIALDDEPLALELLEDNISKVPYLQLAATCNNAMEAIKVLQEMAPCSAAASNSATATPLVFFLLCS